MTKARWENFLIFLGVVFYLFVFPHGIHGDGWVRYTALQSLLQNGKFEPMVYSIVGPILSSPLILLGKLVKDEYWWLSRFNTLVFLGTVLILVRHLRREWDSSTLRTVVLLLFCATMFPKHITDYYAEVFSACAIAIAIFTYLNGRFWIGSVLVCLSVWNTPGSAVAGAALLAFFAMRDRQWRYVLIVPLLAIGILGENLLKYGELFPKAYLVVVGEKNLLPYSGGPGFTYPLFFGVLSVFFAFGKGLIFFSPGILGAFCGSLWRQSERLTAFLLASWVYLFGLILVFARWWSWSGDWFWGPRFYLYSSFVAVFSLVILLQKREQLSFAWRAFVSFALLLSFWVSCQGILFGQDFLEDCYTKTKGIEFMCHYVPEYSVLWRPFIVWPEIRGRKLAYLIYFLLVAGTVLYGPMRELMRETWQRINPFLRRQIQLREWRL